MTKTLEDLILKLNPKNFIPLHSNINDLEKDFSDQYVEKFGLINLDDTDLTYVVLFPVTFQNLVVDIIREYNTYHKDSFDEVTTN